MFSMLYVAIHLLVNLSEIMNTGAKDIHKGLIEICKTFIDVFGRSYRFFRNIIYL